MWQHYRSVEFRCRADSPFAADVDAMSGLRLRRLHGISASIAAFSITARGAVSPVQISNCRAACSRNISSPRNHRQRPDPSPCASAAFRADCRPCRTPASPEYGPSKKHWSTLGEHAERRRVNQHVEHARLGLLARKRLGIAGFGERAHAIEIAPGDRQLRARPRPARRPLRAPRRRCPPPAPTLSRCARAAPGAPSRHRHRCWCRAISRPCATPCSPRRCAAPADRSDPDSAGFFCLCGMVTLNPASGSLSASSKKSLS